MNPDIIEVKEVETELDIVSDFVKKTEKMGTWTMLEGKDAEKVHFEIDLNNLEPISISNSLHVFEERYEINGETYVLLRAYGSKDIKVTIKKTK